MRRPAYLLGTTLLIAAAMQLPALEQRIDSTQAQPVSETRYSTVIRTVSPTPVSTSVNALLPAQPQRWVF